MNEQGFSLLEFIVVISFLSLLALLAIPNLNALTASFRRNNGVNSVEFDIRRARSEAIVAGAQAVVNFDISQQSYTVGLDYLPYSNTPAADEVLFNRVLPNNVTVNPSADLIFDSRGYSVDVDGDVASRTIEVNYDGTTYCTGEIYLAGTMEISCDL